VAKSNVPGTATNEKFIRIPLAPSRPAKYVINTDCLLRVTAPASTRPLITSQHLVHSVVNKTSSLHPNHTQTQRRRGRGIAPRNRQPPTGKVPEGHPPGVLVVGDMLSDALIPMLNLKAADPIEDYFAALRLFEGVADDVNVLIPGHGSVGGADQVRARIEQDRVYVHALRDAHAPNDPRVGPSATFDWMSGVQERQLQQLAQRRERDGTSG